jgi:hypothetical protein
VKSLRPVEPLRLASYALHLTGIDIKANSHNYTDVIPESIATRFAAKDGSSPKTWGEAVKNR